MNKHIALPLWGSGDTFDTENNTLVINRCCGLFSNITVSIWEILNLYYQHKQSVKNIVWNLQEYFNNNTDIYNQLFVNCSDDCNFEPFNQESIYNSWTYGQPNYLGLGRSKTDFNMSLYHTIYKSYFQPRFITDIIAKITTKYNIDYSNAIFVWARGTDKITETTLPPLKHYLDLVEKININNQYSVFLQTDDINIVNEAKNYSYINILEHMPFSQSSANGFHLKLNTIKEETFIKTYNISKIDYLRFLLATTEIASKCAHFICYPGCLATYIPIIRNNFDNCWSFKNSKEFL